MQKDVLESKQEHRNHSKYSLNDMKGISLRKLVILVKQRLRRTTGEASVSRDFTTAGRISTSRLEGQKKSQWSWNPQAVAVQYKLEL